MVVTVNQRTELRLLRSLESLTVPTELGYFAVRIPTLQRWPAHLRFADRSRQVRSLGRLGWMMGPNQCDRKAQTPMRWRVLWNLSLWMLGSGHHCSHGRRIGKDIRLHGEHWWGTSEVLLPLRGIFRGREGRKRKVIDCNSGSSKGN
jgi:hypothetical protein